MFEPFRQGLRFAGRVHRRSLIEELHTADGIIFIFDAKGLLEEIIDHVVFPA